MTRARVLYVAEPIDNSDGGSWKESVERMIRVAIGRGWLAYRPAQAWRLEAGVPVGPEIEDVNRVALAASGAVVAHLPAGVPSVGVPREIEWAVRRGIPTIVAGQQGWSLFDVPCIEIGDTAAFGRWLVDTEVAVPRSIPLPFLLEEGGQLPTRSNPGDAGYDLYVSSDVTIAPGEFVDVPCGVRVAMPPGVWGRITGRSSTWRKRELLVLEGVIDTGYRGPMYAGVTNMGGSDQVVRQGDRIAQLVLHENVSARLEASAVDTATFELITGDGRGAAGFGSSGS